MAGTVAATAGTARHSARALGGHSTRILVCRGHATRTGPSACLVPLTSENLAATKTGRETGASVGRKSARRVKQQGLPLPLSAAKWQFTRHHTSGCLLSTCDSTTVTAATSRAQPSACFVPLTSQNRATTRMRREPGVGQARRHTQTNGNRSDHFPAHCYLGLNQAYKTVGHGWHIGPIHYRHPGILRSNEQNEPRRRTRRKCQPSPNTSETVPLRQSIIGHNY